MAADFYWNPGKNKHKVNIRIKQTIPLNGDQSRVYSMLKTQLSRGFNLSRLLNEPRHS